MTSGRPRREYSSEPERYEEENEKEFIWNKPKTEMKNPVMKESEMIELDLKQPKMKEPIMKREVM
jgi:hypothetical protein